MLTVRDRELVLVPEGYHSNFGKSKGLVAGQVDKEASSRVIG